MLSIGKLSAGQAKYYLDQAEVRVDAVESISDGLEEYYAGGAEARGRWIGSGAAAAFGLSGPADGDALRRVLAGLDPHDGTPLRSSSSVVRVAGFDLTFSAPKSVSVMVGIGGRELRAAVRAAHDRAVVEAVGYLERSAAAVRRGHGGARVEPAAGLVRRRFGIAPRGPVIRSCTRTSWSRTWAVGRTVAGRRWMTDGSTRMRGRRASSTKPSCAPS